MENKIQVEEARVAFRHRFNLELLGLAESRGSFTQPKF